MTWWNSFGMYSPLMGCHTSQICVSRHPGRDWHPEGGRLQWRVQVHFEVESPCARTFRACDPGLS